MPVQSLGWEDVLEKEMATHSSILALEIPWTEEPGGLQSMGSQRLNNKQVSKKHIIMLIQICLSRFLKCSYLQKLKLFSCV